MDGRAGDPRQETLFTNEPAPAGRREIAPGAVHVPGFLALDQQRWIVERFREWAAGPVPLRAALVRGHPMSVQTVCLGWHWQPYRYTRAATDVNGRDVLDFPDWMTRLGRSALEAAYGEPGSSDSHAPDGHAPDGHAPDSHASAGYPRDGYAPDTALVNYYDGVARMGMHQDKDEVSLAPVVSLSIGDACRFRFGNTENRTRPYQDIELRSGDLFVFGGPSRLAFHGVPSVNPGTAPEGCGLETGRINLTLRETGLR